ncbi:hypothetical protein ASPVEDRAFT_29646 [Aspergillus versicolor CBS 583.65]|uniref:Uncharacterized protein n=1 Tax=Aspergillus versicolor CBS 583.65 TaxID=1036611 RepID=A0A1L9PNY0_ASPVE|nr:uncharacterized protein ASPVEDRAFT_29646 [Aspergillus versicolor CBS 583.65]OJJ03115.1 hypothetical protein ASPVEDRAFT_29646 [Aspergillus versicolor CBS 583.65]
MTCFPVMLEMPEEQMKRAARTALYSIWTSGGPTVYSTLEQMPMLEDMLLVLEREEELILAYCVEAFGGEDELDIEDSRFIRSDTLRITWKEYKLGELGQNYATTIFGAPYPVPYFNIKAHLSGYSANPAGAITSILQSITPDEVFKYNIPAPSISQSKDIITINREPSLIRASLLGENQEELVIPSREVFTGEKPSNSSKRVLEKKTGLRDGLRLINFNKYKGIENNQSWYQPNYRVELNVRGSEIPLSDRDQNFEWIRDEKELEGFPGQGKLKLAPEWRETAQKGLQLYKETCYSGFKQTSQ